MAFAAAARRTTTLARRAAATTPLAATTAATTPLAATTTAATTPLAAGSIFGHTPRSAASTATAQLLVTGDVTINSPLASRASSLASAATTILGHGPPSAAARRAATATTHKLLAGGATGLLPASTRILGRPAVSLTHTATLCAAAFSSTTLRGNPNVLSAPTLSLIARRGISTEAREALTPELQRALQRMDTISVERQEQLRNEMSAFELQVMSKYSAARVSAAQPALTAGKVTWRVSTVVLAFGVTTLLTVLQTVKEGWRVDFHTEVKLMLDEMMDKIKAELVSHLREVVRSEVKLVEAEKAASKK